MLLKKKLKSGGVISSKGITSAIDISICNAHSIYISGGNGTVTYKKGSADWSDQAPITLTPPSDAANGWGDGPIWNQTNVSEITITATADCDVIVNSYMDGK